ncbi:hypothetical protein F2P81_026429 [Scophthalmus maximus]|uniref:Uncharacterized protein n=1 Tax=Scophthalmus maximus TaxID=52904 RepID=A0A6A4RMF7_SCOMX|nr:hypothetical protein F2P81_026429 [Scophthalmus maximus]
MVKDLISWVLVLWNIRMDILLKGSVAEFDSFSSSAGWYDLVPAYDLDFHIHLDRDFPVSGDQFLPFKRILHQWHNGIS